MSKYGLQLQDYLGNILYPQTQGSLVNSLNNLTVDTNLQNITNDISTINNDIITINSDIDTINNNINDLQALIDTKAKIQLGSYMGTGTAGSASPNSLTFSFEPKLVIIQNSIADNAFRTAIMIYNSSQATTTIVNINVQYIWNYVNWNGNTISWYTPNMPAAAWQQLNETGKTYNYIAFG